MSSDWATEHLQTIRTLMERSATYRRALAPVFFSAGSIGVIASIVPFFVPIEKPAAFSGYWLGIGVSALTATLLLVRGQALSEKEQFWSPPTRRVTAAIFPAFFLGLLAGLIFLWPGLIRETSNTVLAGSWMLCYGAGLHAAGFFMQRGIKLMGWLFLLSGALVLLGALQLGDRPGPSTPHLVMGFFFGVGHILAGVYLRWTERGRQGR